MDFESFGKIPRLNRDITVTEKLDGTNAAVLIEPWHGEDCEDHELVKVTVANVSQWWRIQAQSRKRLIAPNTEERKGVDNHGFAGWVAEHAVDLIRMLGPGRHFGEWWGQGIGKRYGDTPKQFTLFNPEFHFLEPEPTVSLTFDELGVVPVLYQGPFSQFAINLAVHRLRQFGSVAAPGYSAEGVIVYHTAARSLFKVTCDNDDRPKEIVAKEIARVAAEPQPSIHWGGDNL